MKKCFVIIIVFGVFFSCEKRMPEDLESLKIELNQRLKHVDNMNVDELNKFKNDLIQYTQDANRRGFSKDNSELVNEIISRINRLEKQNISASSSSHVTDNEAKSIEAYINGYNDGENGYGLSSAETVTADESYMAHGYNYSRPDIMVYKMGYHDGITGSPKKY
ncbi:hypothetical protein [Chryseobacterium ginsengisoli]